MKEIDRFVSKLDFDQLLEKIKDWGKTLGRTSMRPVLSLYYVLKSPCQINFWLFLHSLI